VARPELSLVIPIYNEEEVLPQLEERLRALLLSETNLEYEVLFVNDGSKDGSLEILRTMAAREPRFRVASFSRNFGHQRAITAGLDLARGRAVVVMDADLQDPPSVVLEMVAKWREGYDVVYGRRRSREGESWFKLFTARIFYRLFAAMIPIEVPLDAGDFRLMSRDVMLALRGLRESHRFVRGLVSWVGFKQTAVEYDRAARAAGETKYPFRKMLAFALDGIASFSVMPLRLAIYVGILVGVASVLYAIAAVISYIAGATIPGWTTTVVLTSFLFSVQLVMTGVLGEYVGRIYEQVKRRPLYIVKEKINFGRRRGAAPEQEKAPDSEFERSPESLKRPQLLLDAAVSVTEFASPVAEPPPLPKKSGAPPPVPTKSPMQAPTLVGFPSPVVRATEGEGPRSPQLESSEPPKSGPRSEPKSGPRSEPPKSGLGPREAPKSGTLKAEPPKAPDAPPRSSERPKPIEAPLKRIELPSKRTEPSKAPAKDDKSKDKDEKKEATKDDKDDGG